MGGRRARMTVLDKSDNTFAQIKRIGLWHRESPPSEANHERRFCEILPVQSEGPTLSYTLVDGI
jgi:hypothetical protein